MPFTVTFETGETITPSNSWILTQNFNNLVKISIPGATPQSVNALKLSIRETRLGLKTYNPKPVAEWIAYAITADALHFKTIAINACLVISRYDTRESNEFLRFAKFVDKSTDAVKALIAAVSSLNEYILPRYKGETLADIEKTVRSFRATGQYSGLLTESVCMEAGVLAAARRSSKEQRFVLVSDVRFVGIPEEYINLETNKQIVLTKNLMNAVMGPNVHSPGFWMMYDKTDSKDMLVQCADGRLEMHRCVLNEFTSDEVKGTVNTHLPVKEVGIIVQGMYMNSDKVKLVDRCPSSMIFDYIRAQLPKTECSANGTLTIPARYKESSAQFKYSTKFPFEARILVDTRDNMILSVNQPQIYIKFAEHQSFKHVTEELLVTVTDLDIPSRTFIATLN
jgi:hypothetical protein